MCTLSNLQCQFKCISFYLVFEETCCCCCFFSAANAITCTNTTCAVVENEIIPEQFPFDAANESSPRNGEREENQPRRKVDDDVRETTTTINLAAHFHTTFLFKRVD